MSQLIKKPNGEVVGRIETNYEGKQVLWDGHGRILGTYLPATNVTLNEHGHSVGLGNLLMTLIKM